MPEPVLARAFVTDPGGAHDARPASSRPSSSRLLDEQGTRRPCSRRSTPTGSMLRQRGRASREPEIRARSPLPRSTTASTRPPGSTRCCARRQVQRDLMRVRPTRTTTPDTDARAPTMNAPRRHRVDVHGWIVLDKPVGMTSTHAVAAVQRASSTPRRPAMPARSIRWPPASCRSRSARRPRPCPTSWTARRPTRFTVRWGDETDTDDTRRPRGRHQRPAPAREARSRPLLPRFTGAIMQVPPRYLGDQDRRRARLRSRPRRRGGRAARPRPVDDPRAAPRRARRRHRDLRGRMRQGHLCPRASPAIIGRALGCLGHVIGAAPHAGRAVHARRRRHLRRRWRRAGAGAIDVLLPVEGGLAELPCVVLNRDAATRCGAASPSSCAAATRRPKAAGLRRLRRRGDRGRAGREGRVCVPNPGVQPGRPSPRAGRGV